MAKPQNIFLIGHMGAGKTAIGRFLSREFHMEFFDSDHEIEKRTGATIPWIFDIEGEEKFREREVEVIDDLTQKQGIILSTGGGSILRAENRARLSARGVVVYLHVSLELQLERTARSLNRPLLLVDDREATLKKIRAERQPLYEEIADIICNTDRHTVNSIGGVILEKIKQYGNFHE